MMVLRRLVAVAALSAALLLDQAPHVKACSCIAQYLTVCEYAEEATLVAHIKTKSSTMEDPDDINSTVTYFVEIKTLYKGELEDPDQMSFTFSTCGNSACCGVFLEDEEEYLVGLYGDINDLVGESCGLVRTLDAVPVDELTELEEGCDPCDGACEGYEECVMYPGEDYTCAYQSCDPNPCAEDETCIIQESFPPIVTCVPPAACSNPKCTEFQECLLYKDVYYCADVCTIDRCGDEESCSLQEVQCVRAPCPPVAVCTPITLPPVPQIGEYEGCFKDDAEDRVLNYVYKTQDMTNDRCVAHCMDKGAAYAATQYGHECWCYYTGSADFDRHGTEEDEDPAVCETPCEGNKDEKCGGEWAFSLFKLPWPKAPTANQEFLGCYRDTRDERVMTDVVTLPNMTPEICRTHCLDKDALYYATQYGIECWCGSSNQISDYNKHGDGVCHIPCGGDEEYACGGFYAFDLFKFNYGGYNE